MRFQIHESEKYLKMPWKNGQGFTREIRREPAEGDFHWRLSIAQIKENGPFSKFPRYTRIINTLSGEGMFLIVDGLRSRPLLQYDPFVFSGDSETASELVGGPIEDFNFIFNPDFCRAELRWLQSGKSLEVTSSAELLLIYTVGPSWVRWPQRELKLPSGSTLEIENTGQSLQGLTIGPDGADQEGHICLIEINCPKKA